MTLTLAQIHRGAAALALEGRLGLGGVHAMVFEFEEVDARIRAMHRKRELYIKLVPPENR